MKQDVKVLHLCRRGLSATCSKQLFLILCSLFYFSNAIAQTPVVTIKGEGIPLSKVFETIEQQTRLTVFYSHSLLKDDERVSLDVRQASISEVLKLVLKGKGITFTIGKDLILLKKQGGELEKQPAGVSGRVTDESDTPLPGVSVAIKNTRKGIVTDADGRFQLQPGVNDTLVFSFMGYVTQEMPVRGGIAMQVVLKQDAANLGEVVVVGMNNKQTKRSITGAVSTIQTKELRQSPVANLSNALAGRLPGLITVQSTGQPGDDGAAMYIRGVSTYGNTAPLVVIDGLPRSQANFSQLDANEIESVSILKDAASTSLYGIQGANGVIVVTTKRGGTNKKPLVSFTAQQAFQQPIRLPQQMNAWEQAVYYNEYDTNDGRAPRFNEAALDKIKNGSDPSLYPNVNWYHEMLKAVSSQRQYNLNVSGSTNVARYFISGSFIQQGGLLKHEGDNDYDVRNKFDRYNFRSNIDLDVTKRLKVQVDLAGRLENRTGPGPGFQQIFSMLTGISPLAMPIFNPDGSLGAGSAAVVPGDKNPYGLIARSGYYTNYTNVMYGTLSARHDLDFITQGLSAQLFFSFENTNTKETKRSQDFDSYWYRGPDGEGNPIYQQYTIGSRLTTGGSSSIARYNYLDLRINYARNWREHALTAQVLGNRTLRMVDDLLPFAYQGISSRMTYSFRSKYYLEVNAGYNGSENFPKGRRYGVFPAASAGWILSEEPFLRHSRIINFLKLRGSYGAVGNDQINGGRWLFISDYAPGGGYYFGVSPTSVSGYDENRVGNQYVTWERSAKMNAGLELYLFPKKEVQLIFDVFRELRSNILTTPGTVPNYVGIGELSPRNVGKMLNRGFEVELRANKTLGQLNLFGNIQLTYARNKILSNDQPPPAMPYQSLLGYEAGYALGYKFLGFFTDEADIVKSPRQSFSSNIIPGDVKYSDINNDGIIDARDRVPIQVRNIPRYVGGFSFGGGYKGFDVSLLFNGALGGTANIRLYQPGSAFQLQRWTPENKEHARVPVAHLSSNNTDILSDLNVQKTDYLKLRNMEIGYEIPQRILNLTKLEYARFFINGQNLALWDRLWYRDRDPESPGGDVVYPVQRVINIGLNVRF